jgi:hypothetical protein
VTSRGHLTRYRCQRSRTPSARAPRILEHQARAGDQVLHGLRDEHLVRLDEVLASDCPPIDRYSFDFGPFAIAGAPRPSDGVAIDVLVRESTGHART